MPAVPDALTKTVEALSADEQPYGATIRTSGQRDDDTERPDDR